MIPASSMIQPRAYQERAIAATRRSFATGHRAPCLVMPCGAGKTIVAALIIASGIAKGTRCVFIADRETLIDQTVGKLHLAGVNDVRVIQADRDDGPPDSLVTVASAQTLRMPGWLDRLPPADLIIWDECFPAGTLVDGQPIEELRTGDSVMSYNHSTRQTELRRVVRTFVSRPSTLVTIFLDNGGTITCTAGHPMFVGTGYTPAIDLSPGDFLYGNQSEDMRCVQSDIRSTVLELQDDSNMFGELQESPTRCSAEIPKDILHGMRSGNSAHRNHENLRHGSRQGLLLGGVSGEAKTPDQRQDAERYQPQAREQAHEGAQPNAQRSNSREDERFASDDRPPPEGARWERDRTNAHGATLARRASQWMGVRSVDSNAQPQRNWAVDSLQDRHSKPAAHGGGGDRRRESLRVGSQRAGHQEAGVARVARVVRVEIHKRRGADGFGVLCRKDLVYNIEVEGNHNYFVDGILVHNCHGIVADTFRDVLQRYPGVRLLGLTATPTRGDNKPLEVFDDLVIGTTIRELTELQMLAPCHVLRPAPGAVGSNEIAIDPVTAYRRYAAGQRAGVFCLTRKQATEYAEAFNAAGIAAAVVTATTRDRRAILERFAAGEYRVLVSVGCLTQGWDDPGCAVAILARKPNHIGLWLQICGRVLRPHPDKREGLIVDLCGAFWDHGPPDRDDLEYSLTGKAIRGAARDSFAQCRTCGSMFLSGPRLCPHCGAELPVKPMPPPRVVGVDLQDAPVQRRTPWVSALAAKRDGRCRRCGQWFPRGTAIFYTQGEWGSERHQKCPAAPLQTTEAIP